MELEIIGTPYWSQFKGTTKVHSIGTPAKLEKEGGFVFLLLLTLAPHDAGTSSDKRSQLPDSEKPHAGRCAWKANKTHTTH